MPNSSKSFEKLTDGAKVEARARPRAEVIDGTVVLVTRVLDVGRTVNVRETPVVWDDWSRGFGDGVDCLRLECGEMDDRRTTGLRAITCGTALRSNYLGAS